MNSSKNPVKFRACVPFVLNDRVVQWHFEDGSPTITIEVPMRHYPNGRTQGWTPKHVQVVFTRVTRWHTPFKKKDDESRGRVIEVFYICTNPLVSFEDDTIPVVR